MATLKRTQWILQCAGYLFYVNLWQVETLFKVHKLHSMQKNIPAIIILTREDLVHYFPLLTLFQSHNLVMLLMSKDLGFEMVVINAHQQSWWKAMFSVVSVHHSVWVGLPCDRYPWCIGLHCTLYPPPDIRHGTPLTLTPAHASDTWWPSLETCSLEGPLHQYWHLVATEACVLASRQYASYWNAFLCMYASKYIFL